MTTGLSAIAALVKRPAILLLAIGLLYECKAPRDHSSQTAAQSTKGTLEVRIRDHREAIDDFAELEIQIDSLRLAPKMGLKTWQPGWKTFLPSPNRLDLTQYTNRRSALIFKGESEETAYEAFHLKLGGIKGGLKRKPGNIDVKNLIGPILLPFSIRKKETTLIILDVAVLDMSDHSPQGYQLILKGYELYSNGKLTARIPPG